MTFGGVETRLEMKVQWLPFLGTFLLVAIASQVFAVFSSLREAATIILFVPLIWGFMTLRLGGMIVTAVICASLRISAEAVQAFTNSTGTPISRAVTEPILPICLYAALGVAFYFYREKQQRLVDDLIDAQSREAVIQLADGIAHDFNNILTVVTGTADLLRQNESLDEQAREDLQQIITSGRRGREMVRQMRSFTRGLEIDPEPADLSEEVSFEVPIIRKQLPEGMDLQVDLHDEPLPVSLDTAQFHRVLSNLCLNARDAMGTEGALTLRTEVCHQVHRPMAMLTVSDTGEGIDKDLLDRVFEPFYTTKGSHGGTGLGLSIVRSIIRAHDGRVQIESTPGEGTAFHIRLPLRHQDGSEPGPE
jgi:signal transduction histidine kinase